MGLTGLQEAQQVLEAGFGAIGSHVDAVEASHDREGGVPEDAAPQESE